MRIALLTVGNPARLTGGYLYHHELLQRITAAGHHCAQIVLSGAGIDEQLAAQASVQFDASAYDYVLIDALARVVCAPWLAHWQAQRPLIALVHELPGAAGSRDAREAGWIAPLLRADRLIAVSADGAATLRAAGVAGERISIASGGRDRLARLRPRRRARARIVLCVAQWIPRKGLVELISAWRRVQPHGWQLVLAGETDADAQYAGLVRAAIAAAPEIRVLGSISDGALAGWYARAQVFALLTQFEGYGLVLAEALDAGLPLLAGAVGPVPALVRDAGLLVEPQQIDAIADGLRRLCTDRRLRLALAQRARQRAAELPTWNDTARQVLAALQVARRRRVD